jgi:chitinase
MSIIYSLLAYSFIASYQGGGEIQIQNLTDMPVTIKSLSFVTNTNIEGTPYGNLYAYGATMTSKPNSDGITYTITEPTSGVSIPPNSTAKLDYGYTTSNGPLNIGMNPNAVAVTTTTQPVPVLLGIAGHCVNNTCNDPLPGKVFSGYYTDWDQYARQFNATQIPVNKINHILYAFINFDQDGNISLYDANSDSKQLPAISILRQQYPYLHASLSFGGWTLSQPFSPMASNPKSLQNFVNNAVLAMKETGFDGIDIDWEYPSSSDSKNYANLLSALRKALDAQGTKDKTKYYLSIAAPAGVDKINNIQNNDWKIIQNIVDQVNLMTYDYHGAWDTYSDHMSAMQLNPGDPYKNDPILSKYDVTDTVNLYVSLGFSKQKLILGIPAYWRTENVGNANNNGLFQNITGTPPGQFDNTGVFDYACVREQICYGGNTLPSDIQFFSDTYSQVPYGYSVSSKIFATGDDENSVANKANYVNSNALGGMMIWTISGDVRDVNDKNSMIGIAQGILSSAK